jgi:hypothetical protein
VRIWRMMLFLQLGCGRVGFDPADTMPDADPIASAASCADVDLGSSLGPDVASGSTVDGRDRLEACGGGQGNEITHSWVAPSSGRYRIDTCASDPFWDSVLYIHDATCGGPMLGCSDNACGELTTLHGALTLDLIASQRIVIVVDATAPTWDGTYTLAIQKL